jgi:hypothetical protein
MRSSEQFCFYVGSERRPFFFYPNIFKGLSEPLHQLINNRRMAESQAGAAELPDEDPAVFAGFLRLAYEVASTPSKKLFNKTKQNTIVSEKSWLDGAKCPECTIKRPREASGLWLVPTCHKCGWKHPTSGFQRWCSRRWYTHEYYRVSKTAHPLDQDIPLYQEDDGEDMDIDEFEKQPSLQFCAQMYLFADKYLIRDMTVTSLRAFEERLQVYHRASWNSGVYCEFLPELFDMLDFLDSNMSETTYPLRRSLFRYVVNELPRLMQDKEFRELLASKSWIGFAISESVVEAMSVDHDLEL